jgi:hypothetical protein
MGANGGGVPDRVGFVATRAEQLLFAILLVLAVPQHGARAECGCRPVRGYLVSQILTGPECHSPVTLCTRGRLFGDLRESFSFTATSLTPSSDTPLTGVMLYTGDMLITTPRGNLVLKEAGAYDAVAGGRGEVGAVSVVVSGTGVHSATTGVLRFTGTFTPQNGGHSVYEGEICN